MRAEAAAIFICICLCWASADQETDMGDCSGTEKTRQTYVVPAYPDKIQYQYASYQAEVNFIMKFFEICC